MKETQENRLLFFIPFKEFTENGNIKFFNEEPIDMEKFYDDADFRDENYYGIAIFKRDSALCDRDIVLEKRNNKLYVKHDFTVLNAGIKITKCGNLENVLVNYFGDYFDFYINFPSYMVNLEVSRDEIKIESEFNDIFENKKLKELLDKYYSNYIHKNYSKFIKLPYYICQVINGDYGFEKLLLSVDNNNFKLEFLNEIKEEDYIKAFNGLINLFEIKNTNELFKECNNNDYENEYELENKYFRAYYNLLKIADIDKIMCMKMEIDTKTCLDIDSIISKEFKTDIMEARNKAMFMTFNMDENTDKALYSMGKKWGMENHAAGEAAREIASAMDSAMVTNSLNRIKEHDKEFLNVNSCAFIFEYYHRIMIKNISPNVFKLILSIINIPIALSKYYTLEEFEKGITIESSIFNLFSRKK